MQFWEKFALTTVQIALGFASCNFSVAVQFFSQVALSSMRLPIQIGCCSLTFSVASNSRARVILGRKQGCAITLSMHTEVSSSSVGALHDAEVASFQFVVVSEKRKFLKFGTRIEHTKSHIQRLRLLIIDENLVGRPVRFQVAIRKRFVLLLQL